MEFELRSPDLLIRATTAKEVAEICEHFRMDITKHTDALIEGTMTHIVMGGDRPWLHLFADVGFEFLQPYYDLLKKVTGYDGAPFEIAAPRYPDHHVVNLCHTHIVTDAAIDATGYHAECFIRAEDWNGQPAAVHAERNLAEYLREVLGDRRQEPQYIRLENGWMKENPRYPNTRHAPHPACTSWRLFEAIFAHWMDHHATTEQVALWTQGEICHRTICKSESLAASMLRNYSNDFHINSYKDRVSFEQFQVAGKEKA
jgi:hypothetical protein